jgi:hypothetical protein
VKGIHEKDLSWKQFEKYFKKKYLSEKYFDGKTKEFYELKLGQLTIDEYINKFLEMIRYVPYIKDEKVKMQRFISGLPQSFRDIIEFDEPKTLEALSRRQGIAMRNSRIRQNLMRNGRRKVVRDSRRKGSNPQDSRTMEKVLR